MFLGRARVRAASGEVRLTLRSGDRGRGLCTNDVLSCGEGRDEDPDEEDQEETSGGDGAVEEPGEEPAGGHIGLARPCALFRGLGG